MAAPKKSKTAKKSTTKKAATKSSAARKTTAKKTTAKKPAAKKPAATKRPAAKKATAKRPAAKKTAAKRPAAKKTAAKKTAAKRPAAKKTAAKKTAAKRPAAKKTAAKKPAAKTVAKKSTAKKTPAKKTPATRATTKKKGSTDKVSPKSSGAKTAPAKQTVPPRRPAKVKPKPVFSSLLSNDVPEKVEIPKPRGTSKDGVSYTKDFDVKFLKAQRDELLARRAAELARATRLEDEATSLIEDGEMGDVQFDDEGGEGDTMVVQRDLDRLLSGQARQTIEEIDAALARIEAGTYGYSMASGKPIPRERLEAIPETTVLAVEKISGAGLR